MHELSITQKIVSIVAEWAAGLRVRRVRLRIGQLAGVDVAAVRFCFDVCAKGTVVEGASLEVELVAGRAHCRGCDRQFDVDQLLGLCSCGREAPVDLIAGQELLVKDMEVESCAEPAVAPTEAR